MHAFIPIKKKKVDNLLKVLENGEDFLQISQDFMVARSEQTDNFKELIKGWYDAQFHTSETSG